MQTSKKSARRGLLVSATSLLLSVAMLVGTTFAWFTDSVSSGVNQIKAGNLDIELSHKTGSMVGWQVVTNTVTLFEGIDGSHTQWEPGAVAYENLKIKNAGSLALKYVLDFKKMDAGIDYNTVIENSVDTGHSLKDVLYCAIQDETVTNVRPDMSKTEGKPLSEILDDLSTGEDPYIQMSSLEPGAEKQLSIIVYWPKDLENDNDYNLNNGKYASDATTEESKPGHLFINLGLDLDATQYEAENDSFGNDYDKNADGTNKYHGTVQSASVTGTAANGALTLTAPVAPATDNGSTQTTTVTIDGGLSDAGNYTLTTETSDLLANQSTAAPTEGSIVASAGTESASTTPVAKIDLNLFDNSTNTKVFTDEATNVATVTTYIAKGLSNVGVAYIGADNPIVANSVQYNSSTGELTFQTKHFSEYCATGDAAAYIQTTDTAYQSVQDAFNAVTNNDTVTLLKDIETPTVSYCIDRDVTLNLNNKTLSGSGYDGTLCVKSGATLTINGDGKVIGNDDRQYGMAVWVCDEGSKVVINGGDYSNTLTHEDDQMDMIYASNGGNIEINGGTFECVTPKWTLNIRDADYQNCASTITVKGGKFYQYDPANSNSENPAANFCPEGNGTVQDGDWYEVISGTFAVNETTLKAALANSDVDTIYLSGKIALTDNLSVNRDVTIIGKDSTSISGYPVYVAATADVTFKNVNFATPDNNRHNASSVYASDLQGKVVFDGCTFTNPQWECIQITPMDGAEIVVTDCTFIADGKGSYAQANGTKVERLLHIQNTKANGNYTADITNNKFVGVDLCRNAVIDVDDIAAFTNVTCGGNAFANHDGTAVNTLADGMIYVNINGLYDAANVATNTYAQFTQTPAAALHH